MFVNVQLSLAGVPYSVSFLVPPAIWHPHLRHSPCASGCVSCCIWSLEEETWGRSLGCRGKVLQHVPMAEERIPPL